MTRPSVHDPISKAYALDQLTDPDDLRSVAHALLAGWEADRDLRAHLDAITAGEPGACRPCESRLAGDPDAPGCDQSRAWQLAIRDGLTTL